MDLNQVLEQARQEAKQITSLHELAELKAMFLGKKSVLNELMKTMKQVSVEEKKMLGQQVNACKVELESIFLFRRQEIEMLAIEMRLASEAIDVTLPGKQIAKGSLHPLTIVQQEIEDIFVGMGYLVEEGPEVELDLFNFEMLNLPKGHPAREMQDTFYFDETTLLRTHTSPVQVRTLKKAKGAPVKIICPGKVYRRDNDDATHSHQFMQIEGLVVDKNINMADLKGTLLEISKKIFGDDRKIRLRPSFFPFVEPGLEVDVSCFQCGGSGCPMCKQTGWIEILGAGMVHPNVLEMAGYDHKKYQGFAFGMGIERIAILRYGIDDIRHFYTNDVRFLKQF
ncbi:MAG: phenylalanine--tRNA ligase subunit alpha [Bacilli bacterium]